MGHRTLVPPAVFTLALALASAQEPAQLPPVVVTGRGDSLTGTAATASEGRIGGDELRDRALLRPGEVLEAVPGVVITQHSGAGKANQMFARGFNLDHGTDLATSLNGVGLNLPSHGHGQGYTDLNLVIPELIDLVRWRLGPYDVRDGDFGSAGAIDIDYVTRLDRGFVKLEAGSYGFARSVYADCFEVGGGELLGAIELLHDDGRFTVDEDHAKVNGYLSFALGDWRFSAHGLSSDWTATDQIARRAVESGQLSRWDSLDPTDGGSTHRYGAQAEWRPEVGDGSARVLAYGFGYDLDLFSNFTYFLNDPTNGDQFEQKDERFVSGLKGSRTWDHEISGLAAASTLGAEVRRDAIENSLHNTAARRRLSTVRSDAITVTAFSAFAENKTQWTPWLRSSVGLRGDVQAFDVDSDLPANSGDESDAIVSPKAGVVFGPFHGTELYLNGGYGFHSNDARGVLLHDDPTTPAPLDGTPVQGLVRSRGAEVGVRTTAVQGLQSTLSLFVLDLDSELVFVGDAGNTEPSRASRRIGTELATWWSPNDWLTLDADATLTRARFRGDDPAGDYIPGAIPVTVTAGATAHWPGGLSASLRLRHFGARPLIEDDSVRSEPTTLVNAHVAWKLDETREFGLDILNLFDSKDSDIEYFYGSRLAGEPPGGVDDVHFHPVEPFELRFSFTARF